jgi:hypothetical protein
VALRIALSLVITLLIFLRIPESDFLSYLNLAAYSQESSFLSILFITQRDPLFWLCLSISPLNYKLTLFTLLFISKLLLINIFYKRGRLDTLFIYLIFPFTFNTSGHLLRQEIVISLFLLVVSQLNTVSWKKTSYLMMPFIHISSLPLLTLILVRDRKWISIWMSISFAIMLAIIYRTHLFLDFNPLLLLFTLFFFLYSKQKVSEQINTITLSIIIFQTFLLMSGNSTVAMRYQYYVYPLIALYYLPKLGLRLSLGICVICILFNILLGPWVYSFQENAFTYTFEKLSLEQIIYD